MKEIKEIAFVIIKFGYCAVIAAVCLSKIEININHTFKQKEKFSFERNTLRLEHTTMSEYGFPIRHKQG